jgi:hypothetical protein
LARLFRERFPQGKVYLSTWLFDFQRDEGEYAGLFRVVREQEPKWFDGILSATHGTEFPRPLLTRPFPERYPLTCFPEISMYGMHPWGGGGANPLPGFCTTIADHVRGHVEGGWPYSEGIYEDLNKFFWIQFFGHPGRPTDDILAEYAAHYLSPEAADDGVRLFHLLEQTHHRNGWRVSNLDQAEESWELAQAIDAHLSPWAKTSWRWRTLYVRAAIDHVLKTEGYQSPEAQARLSPLRGELIRIYHAENTFIRPADLPQPRPQEAANLAQGRPVTASSTAPDYAGSEAMLVDGIWAEDDPQNFWVHDREKEETAWIVVDLGQVVPIKEVCLQFRGLHGVYWFVPKNVTLAVSDDGEKFETVGQSAEVPLEGSAYSPQFYAYGIGKIGRYVRLELGPSQHVGDQWAGSLELTEVQVFGE